MHEEIVIKKSLSKRIRNRIVLLTTVFIMILSSFLALKEDFLFGSLGILVFGYLLFFFRHYILHGVSDILINQQGIKTRFMDTNKIILVPWENVQDVWTSIFIRPLFLRLTLKNDEHIKLGYSKGSNFLMGIDRFVISKRNSKALKQSLPVYLTLYDNYEKPPFEIAKIMKTELQIYREKNANKEEIANRYDQGT